MPRTRCVAYLRVSTLKQVDEGASIETQREKVDLYARLNELDVVKVLVDAGISAKTLERPGLQHALGMLESGEADALLCFKLDRLTRSVRDLGDLVDRYFGVDGFGLLSVSDQIDTRTAGGRLVLNVLASVSQWEREATAERTSAVMLHLSANGHFVGGEPPFGYIAGADGVLVPVLAEQATIALARDLRAGGLSFGRISRELAARGHVSRSGRPFDSTQVRRFLKRAEPPSGRHLPDPSADFRPVAEDDS